jgi:hypothetical protein
MLLQWIYSLPGIAGQQGRDEWLAVMGRGGRATLLRSSRLLR